MTAPDRQEIEQEIERTREQLGQTVAELAAKVDVPARARGKAAEVAGRVKATVGGLPARARRSQVLQRRWPLAAVAGVVVVMGVGWMVARQWKKG
jgi:predicted RecB family endonuclease